MIRIAHIADTHIDADARIHGRLVLGPDGRNVRAEDRVRCFRAAVDGAIARGCHLVLHAGDLFERNRPTPAEYCEAQEIFERLAAARIPCVLIADNHGSVESATERHAVEPLTGRPGLFISVRAELLRIETAVGPVQVATLPSPRRSIVAAKEEFKGLSPEAVNALVSDKLRAILRAFRARLEPLLPAILMFHGRIQGAWLTDLQQATGSEQIALTPEDFGGWDYVALGDFHGTQQVAPNAWYSGATDRTSFNEEHQAKGWICAELREHTVGMVVVHEFIETPARRHLTWDPINLRDEGLLAQAMTEAQELRTCPIHRVKGQMTQEEYDILQPLLARWREIPTFGEQLEIFRDTTARSREMTSDLTEEGALRLWHGTNNRPEDLVVLLAEHRRIAGAAR